MNNKLELNNGFALKYRVWKNTLGGLLILVAWIFIFYPSIFVDKDTINQSLQFFYKNNLTFGIFYIFVALHFITF
jgi:4-hydroxybenzoate polyprenyltransferase